MVDCENAVFQVTAGCVTIVENILFPGTDSKRRVYCSNVSNGDGIIGCDTPGRLTLHCDGVLRTATSK